eukprot:scaffold5903_cov81-Skeletonema_menzelii.AAC.5
MNTHRKIIRRRILFLDGMMMITAAWSSQQSIAIDYFRYLDEEGSIVGSKVVDCASMAAGAVPPNRGSTYLFASRWGVSVMDSLQYVYDEFNADI